MLRVLLLVAILLFLPSIVHSKSIEKFSVGDWGGGSYADNGGRFTHCAITATYHSGTTLGFLINKKYDLYIGLAKKQWELDTGSNYSVKFYIDDRSLGSYSTNPTSKIFLWFKIGNNKAAFDSLQKGRTLKIKAAKKDFILKLTNSGKALSKIKSCVDQKTRKASVIKDPFASSSIKNPFSDNKRTPPDTSGPIFSSEISIMGKQLGEFSGAYQNILAAINHIIVADEISGALIDKEIQPNFAVTKLNDSLFSFKASMAAFERRFKEVEKRNYKSKKFSRTQKNMFNGLPIIANQVRESMDGAISFLKKAIEGKPFNQSDFHVHRFNSYSNILGAENLMMEAGLLNSKKNHPQYYASKLMILDNKVLMGIYEDLIKVFKAGLTNPLSSVPQLEIYLTEMRQNLTMGRRYAAITKKKINQLLIKNPSNQKWTVLKIAVASYEETFDIEEAIARLFRSFIGGDLSRENAWEQLALLEPLVEERTAIQLKRTRLMGDL
ncbi:MAG: hypothetical protein H8E32_01290 [Nitrospinae bacterium]|nr:hypothetical protein [Nitrospinota bacterium]